MSLPPGITSAGVQGGAASDAVEPRGNARPLPERRRFAQEYEERGLKGVLGVARIGQQPAANTEHHRAVSADDRLEGGLVVVGKKAIEQQRIFLERRVFAEGDAAHLPEHIRERARSHAAASPAFRSSTYILPDALAARTPFSLKEKRTGRHFTLANGWHAHQWSFFLEVSHVSSEPSFPPPCPFPLPERFCRLSFVLAAAPGSAGSA
jgi:hypothetical protein